MRRSCASARVEILVPPHMRLPVCAGGGGKRRRTWQKRRSFGGPSGLKKSSKTCFPRADASSVSTGGVKSHPARDCSTRSWMYFTRGSAMIHTQTLESESSSRNRSPLEQNGPEPGSEASPQAFRSRPLGQPAALLAAVRLFSLSPALNRRLPSSKKVAGAEREPEISVDSFGWTRKTYGPTRNCSKLRTDNRKFRSGAHPQEKVDDGEQDGSDQDFISAQGFVLLHPG
jgi:hypothetical protein